MTPGQLSLLLWTVWWTAWLLIGTQAKANKQRESFTKRINHLILLVFGVMYLFAPLSSWVMTLVSMPMGLDHTDQMAAVSCSIFGFLFAAWARYHLGNNWSGLVVIKSEHELVTTGPYKYVRHPIYTGLLFAMIMTAFSMDQVISFIGVFYAFWAFIIKAVHEETALKKHFGAQYTALCAIVPNRIIPGVL